MLIKPDYSSTDIKKTDYSSAKSACLDFSSKYDIQFQSKSNDPQIQFYKSKDLNALANLILLQTLVCN